ncbi:GNAT family acetyltransferase [Bacillus sp. FJAT-27225]|uniref:GNAT family N-acetyltransferase n=1 Tax=Bacillus sp. FJAT-27225 TaxID=1743144 RepID=UPI00080C22D4|nr:GNAT family N-acetyltransferase [Bacillus sp. FJAT-27225]OCA90473.1 GNAT family acetyltransferase [Bacillus sp. FJAT-27225]
MEIREAHLNDANELTSLMVHLGYPTTVENMKIRFSKIKTHPDYKTLVASYEGRVVGMIGLMKVHYFERDGVYIRIAALVVDPNFRNKGIGNKLIEEAESWARKIGASGITLNSGNRAERKSAHTFYKNRGYEERSIGFVKNMD